MGWLIGLLLVGVGVVIGFFASRFGFAQPNNTANLMVQLEDTKQQFDAYRRDVAEHMATARQLSTQVSDVQAKLSRFLTESDDFLQSDKEWQQPLPFFSEGTLQHIRQSELIEPAPERRRKKESEHLHSEPPRDYSEPGSGLFSPASKEKV